MNWEALLTAIVAFAGLLPWIYKLYKDKKKLKKARDKKQSKQIYLLAEIVNIQINLNGNKSKMKREINKKLKEIKKIHDE